MFIARTSCQYIIEIFTYIVNRQAFETPKRAIHRGLDKENMLYVQLNILQSYVRKKVCHLHRHRYN